MEKSIHFKRRRENGFLTLFCIEQGQSELEEDYESRNNEI